MFHLRIFRIRVRTDIKVVDAIKYLNALMEWIRKKPFFVQFVAKSNIISWILKFYSLMVILLLESGGHFEWWPWVNFINVITHNFYACRSTQKFKKLLAFAVFFAHLGSAWVKAACKMMVKLTPWNKKFSRQLYFLPQ